MTIALMIIVIVLILLLLGGSGYGYYNGGGYASPLAILGALLIIGLIVCLVLGGGIWLSPPTDRPKIEIERHPEREPSKIKIERERGELERKQRFQREPEQPAIERLLKKDSGEVKL